ncbi:Glycosyltransferase involved in cell wall bisynthesis [Chitinophaga costaii]|uniref:Glycosyltransferase involved in cell wall bisynthesis n=1 Tax=Chitinophaga costaii TaxID=1335309 RepID=A0A1C4D1N9_9BACT|nr:glycosyltransferase family 2 protein [Chitinophaga costaii]PUZ24420.1 glycosyl transferase family 2 [Chitinophaga costaii]SCC25201.1 Glycosyltransferase involved in cell wall bisynthesis [Chitinophaga costaii]
MKNINISVGILISTYNWPKALDCVLFSLQQQTRQADEILIADDGSGKETEAVIRKYQGVFNIPVKHVWHEDKGFRKSTILNKAMQQAASDYIIQIDGDIILHRRFVEDHVKNARAARFVQGSRVLLDDARTREALGQKRCKFHFFGKGINNRLNALRIPFLSALIKADPESSHNIKACNLAFWKNDYIAVNGYDNLFTGWGYEDHEFAARLINSGVKKERLKLAAVCYHLNHNINSKHFTDSNERIYHETLLSKRRMSANGLAQI